MRRRLPISRQSLASIAHHEAGHFVVGKALGRQPLDVSIIPYEDALGQVDGEEDFYDYEASGIVVLNPKRARACIVGLYAGAAAQLRFGEKKALVRGTATSDDASAARILESLVSPARYAAEERRLRDRAARHVEARWREIVAVANELLKFRRLDFVHAELAMEIAIGKSSPVALEQYVELRGFLRTDPKGSGPSTQRRARASTRRMRS